MKYKIVATANIFIGVAQILVALVLVFIVIPKITVLYNQFEPEIPTVRAYIAPSLNILLGILNLFLGYKILTTKNKLLEKYFTISIIVLGATFITAGIAAQLSVISIIQPLYNLTSSLE